MFERFTDRARRSIVRAQEEARIFGHNYIGTEHILLGLLAEREGTAVRALESLDVDLEAAREQVRELVGEGSQELPGHIPFTPRAKKVLELSLREALSLHSDVIGTEHLLLGLVAETDGVGVQVLERLGVTDEAVRARVLELVGAKVARSVGDPSAEASVSSWPPRTARVRVEAISEVRALLHSIDRRLSAIERHLGIAPGAEESEPESPPGEGEVPPATAD